MRLGPRSLVVLVGPSGAGKSHWAAANFEPSAVVSSDALRALVGGGESDQRAGNDAFELLDLALERRLARGLLTVVDTLGLDAHRRTHYADLARRHGFTPVAIVFDTTGDVCKARNRARTHPVPAKVLTAQLAARDALDLSMFERVEQPSDVELVASDMVTPLAASSALAFGLQISSFGGDGPLAPRLAEAVTLAESVGFSSIWVMDHVLQIPQVGRMWEDMLESWTTVGWLAAQTRTARIGTLVTGITYRNLAHLAKIVATADVLSGGRVVCGLGAAWWEHEHTLYGWPFPPARERLDLLEDALQLLPVMWGPGSPGFKGKVLSVAETICYPRPLQEHVPLLVGGGGEKRTLALAARYADACNVFGDAATVAHKVDVLRAHCEAAGRDPSDVKVTHLSTAVVARTRRSLDPASLDRLGAGTVEDQVGRYQRLAEAGVETAIVALASLFTPGDIEAFGEVIDAFPKRRTW